MFLNCNSNLTNVECRYILLPQETAPKPGWINALMWSMIILEIVAILVGLVVTTLSIWVIGRRSSIHPNFSRIVIVFTAHFYVLAVSRGVLLLFQTNILNLNDSTTLLLVSSIAHLHEISNAISLFIGIIIERIFATVYIADYEMLKRPEISTVIIGMCVPSSLFAAYALTTGFINNVHDTIIVIVASGSATILSGVIISIIIYRKNKVFLEQAKSTIKYSLSAKFQLVENFRVFQTLMNVVIIYAVASVIGSLAFQLHIYYYGEDDFLSALFSELFDLSHTVGNPCCIAMFVFSTPPWRHAFHSILSRILPFLPKPGAVKVEGMEVASLSYFSVLAASWDNHITPNNRYIARSVS